MSKNVIMMTPIGRLHPHPQNIRSTLGDLRSLTNSIESQGVLEPLLVRANDDGWEIIAGHRRFAAAQEAGLEELPVIVRELDDQQATALMLVENLQREDIDPLDEAKGYFRLIEFGWTQKKLSEEVGVSAGVIRNRLRLLTLPEAWARDVVDGALALDAVDDLSKLVDDEDFDEAEALGHFQRVPTARALEHWIEQRRFRRVREEMIAELPDDEPHIDKESSGAYGGRHRLPRNHVFIDHEDLSYDEEGIKVDVETARTNGHLGWHITTKGYGDEKRVVALPVITDRGYYTRKSSPADPEERPDGWDKEVKQREEQRAERERRKELELVRKARIASTVVAANKTELLDVLLDRVLNDMRTRPLREAALMLDVAVYDDDDEYHQVRTELAVRELSQVKKTQFLTACYLVEDSSYEDEQALLDEYAPFDEDEL